MVEHDTLIFKCGQNANWLGVVDMLIEVESELSLEPHSGTVVNRKVRINQSFSMHSVRALYPAPDSACTGINNKWVERLELEESKKGLDNVIVTVASVSAGTAGQIGLNSSAAIVQPLVTFTNVVRRQESSCGNMIADAMLEGVTRRAVQGSLHLAVQTTQTAANTHNPTTITRGHMATALKEVRSKTKKQFISYAEADPKCEYGDLAIINGGFIRGDTQYPAGTPITLRILSDEFPFKKVAVQQRISGKDMKEGIEKMLSSYPSLSGAFPHLSHTGRLVFDGRLEPMSRILSLQIHDLEVQDELFYNLTLTDFVALGGDGCAGYTKGAWYGPGSLSLPQYPLLLDLIRDFFGHFEDGLFQPVLEGRVLCVDKA